MLPVELLSSVKERAIDRGHQPAPFFLYERLAGYRVAT